MMSKSNKAKAGVSERERSLHMQLNFNIFVKIIILEKNNPHISFSLSMCSEHKRSIVQA